MLPDTVELICQLPALERDRILLATKLFILFPRLYA